jgi:tryptophan-rich sensory protein
MKFFKSILLFLFLNFGALAIGSLLMNDGPTSTWYLSLNKAPWTPPGWVFGFAWFTIMLCFSIYMAKLVQLKKGYFIWILFSVQFILNIIWNYFFFNQQLILIGFINIVLLTLVVAYFLFNYWQKMSKYSLLIVPYFSWLLIASSLNLFILLNN